LKSSGIRIAVITNASLLWDKNLREELKDADRVSLKIDSLNAKTWRKIDRPHRSLELNALLENSISVPDDVSIVGYDDINIAALIRAPLDTIHQSKFEMGEIAATQLIDMRERMEECIARHFFVKPTLVIRKSCKGYPDAE